MTLKTDVIVGTMLKYQSLAECYQSANATYKITNALMFRVGKMRLPEMMPHLMERKISVDCNLKERLAVVFLVTVFLLYLVHLMSSVHIFSELCYYVLPVR